MRIHSWFLVSLPASQRVGRGFWMFIVHGEDSKGAKLINEAVALTSSRASPCYNMQMVLQEGSRKYRRTHIGVGRGRQRVSSPTPERGQSRCRREEPKTSMTTSMAGVQGGRGYERCELRAGDIRARVGERTARHRPRIRCPGRVALRRSPPPTRPTRKSRFERSSQSFMGLEGESATQQRSGGWYRLIWVHACLFRHRSGASHVGEQAPYSGHDA